MEEKKKWVNVDENGVIYANLWVKENSRWREGDDPARRYYLEGSLELEGIDYWINITNIEEKWRKSEKSPHRKMKLTPKVDRRPKLQSPDGASIDNNDNIPF